MNLTAYALTKDPESPYGPWYVCRYEIRRRRVRGKNVLVWGKGDLLCTPFGNGKIPVRSYNRRLAKMKATNSITDKKYPVFPSLTHLSRVTKHQLMRTTGMTLYEAALDAVNEYLDAREQDEAWKEALEESHDPAV